MDILFNGIFLRHRTGNHPENPDRLGYFSNLGKEYQIKPDESLLKLFHTEEYIMHIRNKCSNEARLDSDTVCGPGSFDCALASVSATVAASQNQGFALTRPPGHHAHPNKASGFCIFNNIGIAVRKLEMEGKKVLIFDFDGHLGDGTEDFFYLSNNVLYVSFHQNNAFPNGGELNRIGNEKGLGYTINFPMAAGTGDDIYLDSINTLLPVFRQFNPDITAFSSGFDGYTNDPLLDLRLSAGFYYKLGLIFRENFKNFFAALEGGYNIEYLPKCIKNFTAGINGEKIFYQDESTDSGILLLEEHEKNKEELRKILSPYWKF